MQKKILTAITIICLIGIIVLTYIFLKKESQTLENTVYQTIPESSALILDIKNYSAFKRYTHANNPAWNAISSFETIQNFNNLVARIDSTITKDVSYEKLANNSFVITIHQIGKNKLEYLFLVPLNSEEQIQIASNLIRTCYNDDSLSSYLYDDKSTIHNFIDKKTNNQKVSYSIVQQTLIISPSRILVENAIKSVFSKENLTTNESFAKVKNTVGNNVDANLFINFNQIQNIAYLFADKSVQTILSSKFKLANWGEFDINVNPNSVFLNGFSTTQEKSEYFSVLNGQTPVNFEIKEVLPAGTSTFISLGLSNKEQFVSNYELFLKKMNSYNSYNANIETINRILSSPNIDPVDIKKTMYSLIDNEIAMVYANVNSLDLYQNTFAVLKINSKTQAKEALLGIIDSYCDRMKLKTSSFKSTYKIDEKVSYEIFEIPTKRIPAVLWGSMFSKTNASHFTFIENYLVFGNSKNSLSKFIHAYELKKTLANDSDFKKFTDNNIKESYSWYMYSNISKSYDLYPTVVNDEIKKTLQTNSKELQKFEGFAIQVSSDKESLYSNIFINYNPTDKSKPHTVWESYLDTVITTKPKLVNNFHTNEKNIIVQDAYNNLYLINQAGKIQWKKQLKEQVISDIKEIDFYKNDKIQYVMNTANYIYMIDRIGNFVENYPIKLESEATAGLAVFDYDKTRLYRILIPCKNHKVYLFNKEGKVIKDWKFNQTESEVKQPIKHFKIDSKDYIVFADKLNVYILNRKGETRVKVKEQIEKSPQNTFILEKTKPQLVTTDVKGNIKCIDFNGNVTTKFIKELSPNHFFEYKDIDGNGSLDYIFLDKDKLQAFTQKKDKIFSYNFDADILLPPSIYQFSQKSYKIGVVDVQNSKIYLINGNGSLHEGFPLRGKTLFSIGYIYKNTNTFNLIIGGDENFLYNYEVK